MEGLAENIEGFVVVVTTIWTVTFAFFGFKVLFQEPRVLGLAIPLLCLAAVAPYFTVSHMVTNMSNQFKVQEFFDKVEDARTTDALPTDATIHFVGFEKGLSEFPGCTYECPEIDLYLLRTGSFIEVGDDPVRRLRLVQGQTDCFNSDAKVRLFASPLLRLSKDVRMALVARGICVLEDTVDASAASHRLSLETGIAQLGFGQEGVSILTLRDMESGDVIDLIAAGRQASPDTLVNEIRAKPFRGMRVSFDDYKVGPIPSLTNGSHSQDIDWMKLARRTELNEGVLWAALATQDRDIALYAANEACSYDMGRHLSSGLKAALLEVIKTHNVERLDSRVFRTTSSCMQYEKH